MVRTPVTIGVDLGGTKLLAAVVHGGGCVSSLRRWPRRVAGYEEALDAIADLVASLCREAEDRGEAVVAVGVAIAAFLTARRDRVRGATYLTGWDDRPFPADLEAHVGVPVIIENDADAAAWGEFVAGAGRGEPSVVMTTVGTGIGGGIVADGRLLRGGFGLAGELGHLVVAPGGRPCGCGSRGCLEAYASGTALTQSVRAAAASDPAAAGGMLERAGGDPDRIDGRTIIAAALEGDPMAVAGLREAGEWLGRGLAQVAAVLDPSVLVVGGGLAEAAGDLIADPARAAYADAVSIPAVRPLAPIRLARLGNTAGIVGAATMAMFANDPKKAEPEMRSNDRLRDDDTRTRRRQSGVR
jgi:glucokinase